MRYAEETELTMGNRSKFLFFFYRDQYFSLMRHAVPCINVSTDHSALNTHSTDTNT